jgi:hypothetical protein
MLTIKTLGRVVLDESLQSPRRTHPTVSYKNIETW